jgi:hypothetical protein
MRKLFIFSLSVLISLLSCVRNSNLSECFKYKVGSFYYKVRSPAGTSITKFVRNDTLQTEIITNTSDTGVFDIKWLDTCNYQMKFKKVVSNKPDSLIDLMKSMTIKISILGGTENYYLFESSNDKNNYVLRDTIWLIR